MATFLDASLLSGASSVFGFLLIFSLSYGLLKFSGFFKNSDGLNAIIAVCFAIMSTFSPGVMEVIKLVTPWYTLLMYVIIMILLIVMIFGGLGSDVTEISKSMGSYYRTSIVWIVVISIIIFIAGIASVFLGGNSSENSMNSGDSYISLTNEGTGNSFGDADGKGPDAFLESLFHPKIIGTILFLVLCGVAVLLLGYNGS